SRQNKMNSAVANLLVMLQEVEHTPRMNSVEIRQATHASNGIFDTLAIAVRKPARRRADSGRCDHAVADSLAMFDPILPCRFYRMPHGVTKIQYPTKVAFPSVRHDDSRLNLRARSHQ